MKHCDSQLIITEAERLAALGQYYAALSLLETINQTVDPVRVGLLRGRILIQQGDFNAAIDHWCAVQAIDPNNQEIKQAIELAMNMKDHPARLILLRANLHLAMQYLIIFLLGGIILFQTIYSHSLVGQHIENALNNFYLTNERHLAAIEKRILELEKNMVLNNTALQSLTNNQKEPFREILERLTALEQTVALERESIRALGARQEERITALGMVMGELGTRFSAANSELPKNSPTPLPTPTH